MLGARSWCSDYAMGEGRRLARLFLGLSARMYEGDGRAEGHKEMRCRLDGLKHVEGEGIWSLG